MFASLPALIAAASLVISGPSAGLTMLPNQTVITLDDRVLRLSDIKQAGSLRDRFGDLAIIRLPRHVDQIELSAKVVRQLIQNRLPLQTLPLRITGKLIVRVQEPPRGKANALCFEAARTIPVNAYILSEYVIEVACKNEGSTSTVSYDRDARAPFAKQVIEEGAYLGSIQPARGNRIAKGKAVRFVTSVAGVQISRSASTLQAGREGERVFIQTADGAVFPVPFSNLEKEQIR